MKQSLLSFNALKRLLLTISLSAVAVSPALADVKVIKSSITVPTYSTVGLSKLISTGVVEGISEEEIPDYIINMEGNELDKDASKSVSTWGYTGTHLTTFTNTVDESKSFSIEFNILPSPSRYIANNLARMYVGTTKTLKFSDDMFPLSDYTSIEWGETLKIDVDNEKNTMIITALQPGQTLISFEQPYGHDYGGASIQVLADPSLDNLKINSDSILIFLNRNISLRQLIDGGYIEGLSSEESGFYTVSSTDDCIRFGGSQFYATATGTYVVTYTNSEFPELSFDITVSAKDSPTTYLMHNLPFLYIGKPVTINFPDEVMPLSEFSNIYLPDYAKDPDAEMDIEVDTENNCITFIGIRPGRVPIYFSYKKLGDSVGSYGITVKEAPNTDNFKILQDSIVVPSQTAIYLSQLAQENILENLPGGNSEYMTESSDTTIVMCSSTSGYFNFKKPGKASVTFIHKAFTEFNFTIYVTAQLSPASYIIDNYGKDIDLYVGETKTIDIPEECFPLSSYTVYNPNDSIIGVNISENSKQLILKAKAAGSALFYLKYLNLYGTPFNGIIKVRETSTEVIDGVVTAGTQIGVPVTIQLPDDIDVSPIEGTQIVWASDNEDIASVDSETGEIVANALGKTTITVKRVPEVASRAGEDETIYTIEFWVTELEVAEEMTIEAETTEQISYKVNAGKETYPYDIKAQWSSADEEVATVDGEGSVTGVSEGTTVITISSTIGTKEIVINVIPNTSAIEEITISSPTDCGFQPVYDIYGRVVARTPDQKAALAKGLYIQSGKKILIK